MGSMIHLAVGSLEIDWGKNNSFHDHSALFQVTDVAAVPYFYVKEDSRTFVNDDGDEQYELVAEYKDGMSKSLGQVADRINLLGHTLDHCKLEFEYLASLNDFDSKRFTFDDLKRALTSIDVNSLSADYGEEEEFGKFFRRQIFDRLDLDSIATDPDYARTEIAEGMENLSAYTVLQLLALNPKARGLPVTWQFADIEEGGWANRNSFVRPLDQANRFLIVTEGSSDAKIIRHAFGLLKPHVADFFDYVDMEEGYPFSGTGNLFRFLQGLISIAIQNNVIVLYDNDSEGVANYERSRTLNVPSNMVILKLPDHGDFKGFNTIGPNGQLAADINGRAAAIECYLDLGASPLVRWTSFNSKTETYQGELIRKTEYMNQFLKQRTVGPDYNFSRLETVLQKIIEDSVRIREAKRKQDLEYW